MKNRKKILRRKDIEGKEVNRNEIRKKRNEERKGKRKYKRKKERKKEIGTIQLIINQRNEMNSKRKCVSKSQMDVSNGRRWKQNMEKRNDSIKHGRRYFPQSQSPHFQFQFQFPTTPCLLLSHCQASLFLVPGIRFWQCNASTADHIIRYSHNCMRICVEVRIRVPLCVRLCL